MHRRSIAVAMGIAAALGGDLGDQWFEALAGSPGLAKLARKQHGAENTRLKEATDKLLHQMASSVPAEEKARMDAELKVWVDRYKARQRG